MITLTIDITNLINVIIRKYKINIQMFEHKTFLAMRAVSNNFCCHKEFLIHFNNLKDQSELVNWIESIHRWDDFNMKQLRFYFRSPEYEIVVDDGLVTINDVGITMSSHDNNTDELKLVNDDSKLRLAPEINIGVIFTNEQLINMKLNHLEYNFNKSYGVYDRTILLQSWFNLKTEFTYDNCLSFNGTLMKLSNKELIKQDELKSSDEFSHFIKMKPVQGQKYIGSGRFYDFLRSYNNYLDDPNAQRLKECELKVLEMIYR